MNAAALINRFGKAVTVKRFPAGDFVDGTYTFDPDDIQDISVVMSIQPLNGQELLNLPEGQRTRTNVKGYCATLLRTSDQLARTKADLVVDGAKTYEVWRCSPWESSGNNIQPFWKVEMFEVNPHE